MIRLFLIVYIILQCLQASSDQPNIIFILSDDLGYNEHNWMNNGSKALVTPNFDFLASEAITLHNYYVQPICSPTRSALMTSRYPIRLGTQANVIYWDTPWAIQLNQTFIPQRLKQLNYTTAKFGKWHLGMFKEEYTPLQRGFDEDEGYYQGCESQFTHMSSCCHPGSDYNDTNYICPEGKGKDYRGYDWWNNGEADFSVNHTSSAELIKKASVDFITRQQNSTNPFFLYLPFQNIHNPYTTEEKYYDLYKNRTDLTEEEKTMYGYLTEMDVQIGSIIEALNGTDQYENTVIIYSSDNGAPKATGVHNRNYPLFGHKAQIWEGGTRVPGFVHSKKYLPDNVKGTQSQQLYHVTDWGPTIVRLAGGEITEKVDGVDIWDSLINQKASPRTEILYNINPLKEGQAGAPKAGIRVNNHKLLCYEYRIEGIENSKSTGCRTDPKNKNQWPKLFDLDNDIGESKNIAKENPDIVKMLEAKLQEYALSSVHPMSWTAPFQGPDYFCKDCPMRSSLKNIFEAWTPWINDTNQIIPELIE